jgi:DNA invertase Pin-like site-specific DNA recombinase
MKAIIYIRVSTDVQDNSAQMQEEKCVDYCKFKGYDIVEIIKDVNVSASNSLFKREGGKKLQNVKDVHIITLKLDRMFRNVLDCLSSLDDFHERKCSVSFIDMNGMSLETSTSMGRWFITMLSSFSELERNIISERTKSVLQSKKARGEKYNGSAIFGFMWKNGRLEEHPKNILIVKDIIERIKLGESKSNIKRLHNLPNFKKIYQIINRNEYFKYW